MLASYISVVLCSLIASFIDVLSLTVQCQACLFGEALHLGAYLGTHLHVRTETATLSTMSRLEAATTELSAVRLKLERLQAENARSWGYNASNWCTTASETIVNADGPNHSHTHTHTHREH